MDCDIVKDLIPLYIDGCCSEKSRETIGEHLENCESCKKLFEEMQAPADIVSVSETPLTMSRISDWKASVLQSVLLYVSFALIAVGVALEAKTSYGTTNGFWTFNLIIPTTGFMLSLANWYFVRIYENRNIFSNCSLVATLGITLCAYIWAVFHYELNELFIEYSSSGITEMFFGVFFIFYFVGILLTAIFCILSKILSDRYAKMLGKE